MEVEINKLEYEGFLDYMMEVTARFSRILDDMEDTWDKVAAEFPPQESAKITVCLIDEFAEIYGIYKKRRIDKIGYDGE